jgi:hypothetical protein
MLEDYKTASYNSPLQPQDTLCLSVTSASLYLRIALQQFVAKGYKNTGARVFIIDAIFSYRFVLGNVLKTEGTYYYLK